MAVPYRVGPGRSAPNGGIERVFGTRRSRRRDLGDWRPVTLSRKLSVGESRSASCASRSWPVVLTRAQPMIAVMPMTVSLPSDSGELRHTPVRQETRHRDLGPNLSVIRSRIDAATTAQVERVPGVEQVGGLGLSYWGPRYRARPRRPASLSSAISAHRAVSPRPRRRPARYMRTPA